MRVTKAVRSYIEKQVEAKIAKKYEWEKNESHRIRDLHDSLLERARDAATQAAKVVLEEAKKHTDVLEYKEEEVYINWGYRSCLEIKDRMVSSSVHQWQNRMNKEVDEIVENIIVTLELGGNKADLDRMLSEL